MQKRFFLIASALVLTLLLLPWSETKAAERAWEYTLTPYVWTVSLDGEIGVQGRTTSVDANFSDLLTYVDVDFTESGFTYDATMYGLNLGLGFTF